MMAADVTGNGLPDIVVGNKKGTFVHIHSTRKVSKKEYDAAQPKPINKSAAAPINLKQTAISATAADQHQCPNCPLNKQATETKTLAKTDSPAK